jgi:choline dehydrogenase-like flavoprotein
MTSTPLIRSAETFDFVIVGAGSAGCVLANRLTEDPSIRVLVLEAGPKDTLDPIPVPALFSALFGSEVDWNYQIENQTHYHGSTTYPRGRTLGGSSSINLMVYIRGQRADFDGWDECGNAGWDYDSVLPYFVKAEHNSRLGAPFHGNYRQTAPAIPRPPQPHRTTADLPVCIARMSSTAPESASKSERTSRLNSEFRCWTVLSMYTWFSIQCRGITVCSGRRGTSR